MSLVPFSSSDAILHVPTNSGASRATKQPSTLIFFLTGNPGLISYYDEFLELIAQPYNASQSQHGDSNNLDVPSDHRNRSLIVAGFSLGGFTTPTPSPPSPSSGKLTLEEELSFPPSSPQKDIYTLQDQINLCYARLTNLIQRIHEHYAPPSTPTSSQQSLPPIHVILIGHSVGAYIALELTCHHYIHTQSLTTSPTPFPFNIISSILLTPTLINISLSPSGQLATPLLTYLPFLPALLQLLSNSLTSLLPISTLSMLVSKLTGMRPGTHGLKTTVDFLTSKNAVRQALSMARDEMSEIGGDKWGDEVWGVLHPDDHKDEENEGWEAPRLFMLFAGRDHWVAEKTREEVVARFAEQDQDGMRRGKGRGTTVIVDEADGLVHAWCLEQSSVVAGRVRGWIAEILDGDRGW